MTSRLYIAKMNKLKTILTGPVAELTTNAANTLADVPISHPGLVLQKLTKIQMSRLRFRRRHLYPNRVLHRQINHLILTGLVLVGVMSIIIATPQIKPVEAQVAPPVVQEAIEPYPQLVGGTEAQNEVIRYAWEISGKKIDFIYTLNGENGRWDYQRVHNPRANTVGTDMGLCGTNSWFHPEIVTDPRFFTDWKWQTDRCYQMWAGGVKFYGYSTKNIVIK